METSHCRQRGISTIFLVSAIAALATLSVGIFHMSSISTLNELSANNIDRAKYLADAGIYYVQAMNWQYENVSGKTLDDLMVEIGKSPASKTYDLGSGIGQFTISSTVTNAATNTYQVTVVGATGNSGNPFRFQRTSTFQYNNISSQKGIWYFPFTSDTVSGTKVIDLWSSLAATLVGSAKITNDGVLGKALAVTGSGCQSLSISYTQALNWTPSGTIMLWVYFNSISDWDGVLHKGDSSHANNPYGIFDDEVWSLQFSQDGYQGVWDAGRRLMFALMKSNTEWAYLFSGTRFSTKKWYHVTVTYGPSGIKFYINSVLDSSTTSYVVPRQNTSSITMGAQTSTGGCYTMDGKISEPQAWGKELPLTDSILTNPSIEREYCRGAQALGWDKTKCKKYTY
jgi:hypothetical protein